MISEAQESFAQEMVRAAIVSGHIWPGYAAAEACLESSWGLSKLCVRARNVFGLKTPSSWIGATISIPTQEYLNGKWVMVNANWPVFDTYPQAFLERQRVLNDNPIYADALAATSGEYFVMAVSKHWATDPERGDKCLSVYNSHRDIFANQEVLT